jgi:ATP-dependent RNA helicase DeaD
MNEPDVDDAPEPVTEPASDPVAVGDAPFGFDSLNLRPELLSRAPRLRGAHADPARGHPAAARGPRPPRPGRHRHRQDGGVRAADPRAVTRRPGGEPLALVLVPTRELAMQVSEAIHKYGRDLGAQVVPIYGGQPIHRQLQALRSAASTSWSPRRAGRSTTSSAARCRSTGRDRRARRGRRDARHGLRRRLEAILDARPTTRQTVLFSATMPPRIARSPRSTCATPCASRSPREQNSPARRRGSARPPTSCRAAHKAAALGRILDVEAPTARSCSAARAIEVDSSPRRSTAAATAPRACTAA